MNDQARLADLRGDYRENEPMCEHTSWRVGGPARRYYRPADREDLLAFLRLLPQDEPLLWVGLGSNLLIRDGGWPGTVLHTQGRLTDVGMADMRTLHAEAGVSCAVAARFAARQGLCGLEYYAGIPGTVGGALAMNAGAFGGETWQRVEKVDTVDRHGVVRERGPEDFEVSYRQVSGPEGEWFLAGYYRLAEGDVSGAQRRIRQLLARRAETQPTNLPSGGSTFRNPEGDYAARLIEASDLKGLRVGGAEVSSKHANFIVNIGEATATDIETLIGQVREQVEQQQGVRLRIEVHIVGEAA